MTIIAELVNDNSKPPKYNLHETVAVVNAIDKNGKAIEAYIVNTIAVSSREDVQKRVDSLTNNLQSSIAPLQAQLDAIDALVGA